MTMDDPFFDIVSDIDIDNIEDIVDVTSLSTFDLLSRLSELEDKLFSMNEALQPNSQEARDLHSLRAAVFIEIQKRKKSE